jgi:predicted TIM-barrel fold metal-dependent hydrolase
MAAFERLEDDDMIEISRRKAMAAIGGAALPRNAQARPKGYLVENTLHMFAEDQTRFPFHPNAPYKPPGNSLDKYIAFVKEARLDHTVLVQPEPYQDDETYVEYCFTREPSPGYFKATCLYDPIDPTTPGRIEALVKRNPGRIVGMRIHAVQERDTPFTTSGAIKNRDLKDPAMKPVFRKIEALGLMVQVQLIPCYAPQLGELASEFRNAPVLIDHFGLIARGTPAEYEEVIKLSKQPQFYMKLSQLPPNPKPMVRRVYDAFGPDRLIWGSYGSNVAAFNQALAQIDDVLDFAPETERVKIRGGNAMKLFQFRT